MRERWYWITSLHSCSLLLSVFFRGVAVESNIKIGDDVCDGSSVVVRFAAAVDLTFRSRVFVDCRLLHLDTRVDLFRWPDPSDVYRFGVDIDLSRSQDSRVLKD